MTFLMLGLGLFLLGAMAFAIDLGAMWFTRQSAQTAADAACAAGAMDLLLDATNGTTTQGGFTAGTNFDCNTSPTAAPCQYAALNGYSSNIAASSTARGNNVSVLAVGAPPGVTAPSGAVAPNAFLQVQVKNNMQTFFGGLLTRKSTQTVRAFATCGVTESFAPIPIVVLDKVNPTTSPSKSAFTVQGTPTVTIFGGPTQSIQVNSSNAAAVTIGGSALVDLHLGGPANTGSSFGTYGGPFTTPSIPSSFNPGTTGKWLVPSTPIGDPFALLAAPPLPATGTVTPNVPSGTNGCPAPTSGPITVCDKYSAGYYPGGICVGSSCPGPKHNYAIFDPGIYYLGGDLQANSNSCLRNSTAPGQGIGGVMFYFHSTATVQINSNSGGPGKCASIFNTASGTGSLQYGVACGPSTVLPTNLPATFDGNVLLAPCTGTYGDPYLAAGNIPPAGLGQQRGMLFFQDRAGQSVNPNAGGGGAYILAGTMYFHSCNGSGAGTNCLAPPTAWNDILTLQGGSGSSTYVLGQIIVDNLVLGGNSSIYMDLNPTSAFRILKAAIYQ